MATPPIQGSPPTAAPTPTQQRITNIQARAQEDAGRIAQLSPDQIAKLQAYQNNAVGHIDQIKYQTVQNTGAASLLDSFRELQQMRSLTTPTGADNDTARDVKQSYQQAYTATMRDQAQAARLYDKFGPGGPYPQADGSQVQISRTDDKQGYKVDITGPDGGHTTTEVNGDAVSTQRTDAGGNVLSTSQKSGSWVQQSVTGGKTTTWQQTANGQPQRITAGPPDHITETTTVNDEGSTDTARSQMADPSQGSDSTDLGTVHSPPRAAAA